MTNLPPSKPHLPALTVVIPTSGRPAALDRTLHGLTQQTMQDFQVTVCDDGTDDGVGEVCGKYSAWLDVHCARVNAGRGAGYARNRGIESALSPRVLFLDDDCVPHPDVTAFHCGFTDQRIGVIGLRRMVVAAHHDLLTGPLEHVPWEPEKRDTPKERQRMERLARQGAVALFKYAFTCHVSYPLTALLAVGGFWEQFRGAGFEDLELALRLCRWGVKLLPCFQPAVYHQNHSQSKLQTENFHYNRELYAQTVNTPTLVRRPGALRHIAEYRDAS